MYVYLHQTEDKLIDFSLYQTQIKVSYICDKSRIVILDNGSLILLNIKFKLTFSIII